MIISQQIMTERPFAEGSDGASAWCASSMTMVWKSGTRRARAGAAAERLHAGHHGGGVIGGFLALHHANGQIGGDELQLVHGLMDEFIAVRQDEGTA